MRTIKFRAWDKERKEMYVFDLDSFNSDDGSQWLNCENNKILYYGGLEWGNCELMQFTGLHDKNGKEIYEGDIITYPILGKDEPIKREVKFYNGAFGVFTGNGTRYPTGGATTEFGLLGNGLVHEVIGNVWESPELLVPTPSK